mmetsp:Transcript_11232/g.48535  ORF Transcript_11232/g.48535 Transcript_11232/m.48535 type:complete len:226 (+) Transcript_11232:1129-1806(+)
MTRHLRTNPRRMTTPPRNARKRQRQRLVSRVSMRTRTRRMTTMSISAILRCLIRTRTTRRKSVAARKVAVSKLQSIRGLPVSRATLTMRLTPRWTLRSAKRRNPWTLTSSTMARWPRLTDTSPGISCTRSQMSQKNPRRKKMMKRATTGFRCGSTMDRTWTATTRFSERLLRLGRMMTRKRSWRARTSMRTMMMRRRMMTKTPSLNPKSQSQRPRRRSQMSPSPS